MNRRQFATLAVAFCASAPACARKRSTTSQRIISLSPSTTEALFAIGAGALVVGRSRYCNYPRDVLNIPQVGGYVDPNLEAVIALAPTLVTGARGPMGPTFVDKLTSLGIATYFPETENLAAIGAMINGLGERTNRHQDAATFVDSMNVRVTKTANTYATRPQPRTLLIYGTDPIVAAGPQSFADEMLRLAHATNAVTKGNTYPTMSLEHVVVLDPDIIVNATFGEGMDNASRLSERAGWSQVRAVRQGHVVELRDEAILRPGPRVPDAVNQLAQLIHG